MITVTLTNDGMGDDVTEADFEAWVAYVAEHIDVGFKVDVSAARFNSPGSTRITGLGFDEDKRDAITNALIDLWDDWCAAGAPRMGRPIDTSTPIGKLADRIGSVEALAQMIGVSTRTVRYWARGKRKPGGPAAKALERHFKFHGIDPKP